MAFGYTQHGIKMSSKRSGQMDEFQVGRQPVSMQKQRGKEQDFHSLCDQHSVSHLHFAAHGNLVVPCSRMTRYGQRSFTCFWPGLTLYNSLPLTMYDPSLTLAQFCALLKTVLQSLCNTTTATALPQLPLYHSYHSTIATTLP